MNSPSAGRCVHARQNCPSSGAAKEKPPRFPANEKEGTLQHAFITDQSPAHRRRGRALSCRRIRCEADNYPSRNITLVLPFAAGSGTDTTPRLISQHLSQALGVGIVIENKAGANGMIAATFVARSAPDGYTLLDTTNTTHSANPFLLKSLTYDPVKDFTPIARTGDLPFMLVVHPDFPAKTVGELVAYAKANPGKLSYASGSSSAIVSGATFAKCRADLPHVPYKKPPPASTTSWAAASDDVRSTSRPASRRHGNALRALAVTTRTAAAGADLP